MYTLMMIDPDVAASSIATEDRPLMHWLVANIRNGNVSSGKAYSKQNECDFLIYFFIYYFYLFSLTVYFVIC